jgi:Trk-type K+ transport system membrane component
MTKPYKAVAAFLLTFLASLIALVQDATSFSDLTLLQWLIAVSSALVTSGVVYGVTNPPAGT